MQTEAHTNTHLRSAELIIQECWQQGRERGIVGKEEGLGFGGEEGGGKLNREERSGETRRKGGEGGGCLWGDGENGRGGMLEGGGMCVLEGGGRRTGRKGRRAGGET